MDLAQIHVELVHAIRDGMSYVAPPLRIAEMGRIFDELALQLEGLALCHLLENADQAAFAENLARSGHARRFFLRRSRLEKNQDDRHLALSGTRCFLDALIAGSLTLAQEIATLSIATWNAAWEYEDDYCFYLFLHTIVKQPAPFPTPEMHTVLNRFERSLEGGNSVHLNVAKALVARDPDAFKDTLLSLLSAEAAQIEKGRQSAAVHERDILFWPKSRVSIDGLALLKIAELVELPMDGDFPLCPQLARLPWSDQTYHDLFEDLERLK
jgi:hypothetical protein